jgi:hypothetical protein
MIESKKFDITVADLAIQFTNPRINTPRRLFKFLRTTGVLAGMTPNPLLEKRGLLTAETRLYSRGRRSEPFQKVLFSKDGVVFVNQLSQLYYGQ